MQAAPLHLDTPPWHLSGTVLGALLNDPAALAALGDALHQPPHKAPPRAPVLEVKPRHTWATDGDAIAVPGAVLVGVSLAIVLGHGAHRVQASDALALVAGWLVAGDLSLPLPGHYRPSVRLKARDGFCPLGQVLVPAAAVPQPDALATQVLVDGVCVQRASTAGRQRGVAQLIADVSQFMTLQPGDVLLLGATHGAPLVLPGQAVQLLIDSVGTLGFTLVAEA